MYPGAVRTAVDDLCLGVTKGNCFGLLGINGRLSQHIILRIGVVSEIRFQILTVMVSNKTLFYNIIS